MVNEGKGNAATAGNYKFYENMRMQCDYECNKQIKHTATTKTWKASEASVSGRHNTPPLTRDLVPRSRDGTGEKRKRKR